MDAINISTIVTSLSHLWTDAQHNRNFPDSNHEVHDKVEAVFRQSLQQLQPRMQGLGGQAISNIVWSSAKLGLSPDKYVPGIVRTLINRFLWLVRAANKKQQPSAQGAANVLWALATMHHPAATRELVESVCSYLANLMQHPEAQQRPTAQAVSNVLLPLAQWGHSLENGRLLDDFCMYMHSLLHSEDPGARPTAQAIANLLWALSELKHAPRHEVVSPLLDHMVALCQTPSSEANPQNISNCLLACAMLRLQVPPTQVEVLSKHLLEVHVSNGGNQDLSNLAWSLAVMGLLNISMFDALLHQLTVKHKLLAGEHIVKGTSVELFEVNRRQLHQALEWLKPP